eukprot:38634-Chlamydomonas_euryale.AAC.1
MTHKGGGGRERGNGAGEHVLEARPHLAHFSWLLFPFFFLQPAGVSPLPLSVSAPRRMRDGCRRPMACRGLQANPCGGSPRVHSTAATSPDARVCAVVQAPVYKCLRATQNPYPTCST